MKYIKFLAGGVAVFFAFLCFIELTSYLYIEAFKSACCSIAIAISIEYKTSANKAHHLESKVQETLLPGQERFALIADLEFLFSQVGAPARAYIRTIINGLQSRKEGSL